MDDAPNEVEEKEKECQDFNEGDTVIGEEFEDETSSNSGTYENDAEMSEDFAPRRGRGGFRGRVGRGWMGPRGEMMPPRFRGRGFGPPPFRGRGPPPPMFMRGGPPRNPPPGGPFNGPSNFNGPNWNGPPMMHNGPPFGPPGMMGPPPMSGPPPFHQTTNSSSDVVHEMWIETKTPEGKSYFYNARTRETTWTKPDGPNVKVVSHDQVEEIAQQASSANTNNSASPINQSQINKQDATGEMENSTLNISPTSAPPTSVASTATTEIPVSNAVSLQVPPPIINGQPPPSNMLPPTSNMPPLTANMPPPTTNMPPPTANMPPPTSNMPPPNASIPPPSFSNGPPPAFALPPPGFPMPVGWPPPAVNVPVTAMSMPVAPPGSAWPGPPPPPWAMPPSMLSAQTSMLPPPVTLPNTGMAAHSIPAGAAAAVDEAAILSRIDPDVISKGMEWTEHTAPDGRFYYYNASKGESVWEKPQPMKDLEAAKLSAQQAILTAKSQPPQALVPVYSVNPTDAGKMPIVMSVSSNGLSTTNTANIAAAAAAAAAVANAAANAASLVAAKHAKEEEERIRKAQEEALLKKKEEEEKAKEAKAQDKTRPVSSTPVPGTPWCVVWTGDGRVFFYNPSSKTSVWERPEELLKRADVDKMVSTPPEPSKNDKETSVKGTAKETTPVSDSIVTNSTNATSMTTTERKRGSDESDSEGEEVPSKKAKLEAVADSVIEDTDKTPMDTSDGDGASGAQKKIDIGKEAAIEAEVKAAKERAVIPLETRIKLYKEMLAEKHVSAFSTWEKELHKIVFDSRYLLLTSKERKQVFEKYVKERAEEERREKRNKLKEKKDAYKRLMAEAHLTGKSSFSDFASKYVKDERFKGVDKMRERESLFNEYLIEVRKKEKEDKLHRRDQVRKDFMSLLREHTEIDRHAHWADVKRKLDSDPRYRAVESSNQREDWFREHCKILKEEKKKSKEKEREQRREEKKHKKSKEKNKDKDRDRDRDADRDKRKSGDNHKKRDRRRSSHDDDRTDEYSERNEKPRSTPAKSAKPERDHRERSLSAVNVNKDEQSYNRSSKPDNDAHTDYDKKSEASEDDEERGKNYDGEEDENLDQQVEDELKEKEAELKEKEKQARAAASLREREKQVQRTLATHMRDRDKEREHHKRDEAIQHFNALLADLVRNHELSWREVKKILKKDHRWDLADSLSKDDKEKLFNEHIEHLLRKKREKFRELLDETSQVTLVSAWKEIKRIIKEDPRYSKFASSERCEREFKDYLKDKLIIAKGQFKELLQETKLITHKSLSTLRDNESHMQEIEDILKNDKRYLVLDHIPQERTQLIISYLEDLDRRGPPPPPTASEPSRRSK